MNYEFDNFGFPKKKIKLNSPKILYCSKIILFPHFFFSKKKIYYCLDLNKYKTLDSWHIDETLSNFSLKLFFYKKKSKYLYKKYFYILLRYLTKLFIFKTKSFKKNHLCIFGPHVKSYSHQLIDFITRLIYVKYNSNLKDKIIFVDYNLKKILTSEVFAFIFKNLKIKYYNSNQITLMKNVNYLTHIENRFTNKELNKTICLLNKDCKEFPWKNIKKYEDYKYVLVSRNKAKNRNLVNENILFERLQDFGFKRIFFEDMTYHDQINVSLNAKILIGYHGAGMVNLLFMNMNSFVIEIFHKSYSHPLHKIFGKSLKIKYKKFICNFNFSNYDGKCDVNEILNYVKKITLAGPLITT